MIAILAIGCKKKEEFSKTIDPKMKQYFSFQPGTYWIYKDSVSGKEDSFYVSQNTTTTKDGIEYNETLIMIHGDTAARSCSINLHQTGLNFSFQESRSVGFSFVLLGNDALWINITTTSVNGSSFDSVKKVESDGSYWLRHNLGLIRIAPNKGPKYKIWELLRYRIVK